MSAAKNNGGPAFPSVRKWKNDGDQLAHAPNGAVVQAGGVEQLHEPGMTLRDKFAESALIGVLYMAAHRAHDSASSAEGCATTAYKLADAMLKARDAK